MTTIATLAVKLIGDIANYSAAMSDAVKTSQKTADEIGKNIQKAGKSITSLGQTATAGLTLPIAAAGLAAIDMASSYEESKNKVQVVFGDMSNSILEWSTTSSTAFGMSEQQALAAAGTYGNLFTALGLAKQPSAEMSMSLVQLAGDLASFNDANPQDVLDALRSGLSGEIEPLKKYGVAMNDAILKNKAMEMGMGDNIQALTEAQKLQLRYAIIMEQTATAQGDFARTADGMANSQRTLTADLADAGRVLGTYLLPYALQFVQWISGLVTKFQSLTPEQQKWVLLIAGAAAAIGPVLMVVGSLVTAIGAIIPVVTAVAGVLSGFALPIIAIIAAIALLYLAWTNNWGGIQEKTQAAITFVQTLIDGGMQFINDLTSGKLGWLSQLWNNAVSSVMAIVNTWIANIKLLFQAFQAAWNGDWYKFGEILRQMWDNTWTMMGTILKNGWSNFKIIISEMVTGIINFFKNTDWGMVGKNIVEGIANGIKNGASAIANAAMSAAKAALEAVQGFLGIHSESKVFKAQVGWEMAAGTASGFMDGLDRLLKPAMVGLQPVPVTAGVGVVPSANVSPSGGGAGAGGSNEAVTYLLDELLRAIKDMPNEISRSNRSLVEKFGGQRK